MYSLKNLLAKQPVQISAAVVSVLNLAIVAGWVHISAATVAGANTSVVLVLGLFVGATTTNTAKLRELAGPRRRK